MRLGGFSPEDVDAALVAWALWASRVEQGGMGYPSSTSVAAAQMYQGAPPRAAGPRQPLPVSPVVERVDRALARLRLYSAPLYAVVVEVYLQNRVYVSVARDHGVSERTIRHWLALARSWLAGALS